MAVESLPIQAGDWGPLNDWLIRLNNGGGFIPVNFATAFRPFIAAVANRSLTPANMLFLGDSITEGQAATTAANRWIELLRDGIRSNFPVAGVAGGVGFMPPYRDSSSLPQPSTLSAVLTKGGNGQGLGNRISVLVNIGDTQTYTVTGTAVDVINAKIGAGGGAFTIATSSDGGTTYSSESAVVSCDGAGSFTDMLFTRVTFARRGSWKVRITCSTANAHIGGIMVYDGDEGTVGSEGTTGKGVRLWEGGHFGSTTVQQAAYLYTTRQSKQIAPSLVVIELGVNDYANSGDAATFTTNLQTIITNIRTGCTQGGVPSPTIVLLAVPLRTGTFTGSTWAAFVAAMKSIALVDDHVTVMDLSAVISSVSDNSLLLFADAVHPDNRGHAVFAAYMTGFLIPSSELGTSQLHGNEMHTTPMVSVGSLPFTRFKPGAYYSPYGGTVVTSYQPVNGDLRLAPITIGSDTAVPFDRISVNVTGPGTASVAKTRLVIYSDSGQGYPGALKFDSGQLAADAAAEVFAALTGSLLPGLYWIGAVTQGAPAAVPAYYGISGAVGLPVAMQNVAAATGAPNGVNTTAVTGAPPDPFPTALAAVGSVVKAYLRAA